MENDLDGKAIDRELGRPEVAEVALGRGEFAPTRGRPSAYTPELAKRIGKLFGRSGNNALCHRGSDNLLWG
jgi:hypothetical protein